jgi:hypothetical protein
MGIPSHPTDIQFLKAAKRKRPEVKIPMNATPFIDAQSIVEGKLIVGNYKKTIFGIGVNTMQEIFVTRDEALQEIP